MNSQIINTLLNIFLGNSFIKSQSCCKVKFSQNLANTREGMVVRASEQIPLTTFAVDLEC